MELLTTDLKDPRNEMPITRNNCKVYFAVEMTTDPSMPTRVGDFIHKMDDGVYIYGDAKPKRAKYFRV